MEFHELSALLYRDNIREKHDAKKRLHNELEEKKKPEEQTKKAKLKAVADAKQKPSTMAVLLMEHLIAVSSFCCRMVLLCWFCHTFSQPLLHFLGGRIESLRIATNQVSQSEPSVIFSIGGNLNRYCEALTSSGSSKLFF